MESEDQDSEHAMENLFRQEFELLRGMFENHFSPEVIAGVLEDCDGDVNLALDTLTKIEDGSSAVNIALDGPSPTIYTQIERDTNEVTACRNSDITSTNVQPCSTPPSYAAAIQIPPAPAMANTSQARHSPRAKNVMPKIDSWTPQMRNVIKLYIKGARVLVLMRGPPGCGKSYLARSIVESTVGTANPANYTNHIFSADDLMLRNGEYYYDRHQLDYVHSKTLERVSKSVSEGRSPVIVDNTNMMIWEMLPFAQIGVQHGYIIEVVEPLNCWTKTPAQLAKRNTHGVPIDKIKAMIRKYEGTCDGDSLIKYFKLSYPDGMEPPVIRIIPPYNNNIMTLEIKPEKLAPIAENSINKKQQICQNTDTASAKPDLERPLTANSYNDNTPCTLNVSGILNAGGSSNSDDPIQRQKPEVVSNLHEMLMIDAKWDNGEKWETAVTNNIPKTNAASSSDPKPPRSEAKQRSDKFIEPSMIYDDWTKNLSFMQPEDTISAIKSPAQINVQTETASAPVNVGDFINYQHTKTPTDINEIPNEHDKKLNGPVDDGTTSLKPLFSGIHKCEQTDNFFINMRKMFKNVPRPVLREIYDNCARDGNWACSIVLDGLRNNTIETVNADLSDSEEEVHVECQCEERYNEISADSIESMLAASTENKSIICTPSHKKKAKKEKTLTEESSQVLQNIKKSIQFSENHYSQHYLNRKKIRDYYKESNNQNASNTNENSTNDANISQSVDINKLTRSNSLPDSCLELYPQSDTSQNILYRDIPSTSSASTYAVPVTNVDTMDADDEYEDDDNDTIESDDEKSVIGDNRNVIVNIGMDFVRTLDELYGRHDFEYPKGVKPVLSIPTKILYDLNALWVESITYQLDKDHTQTDEMIKQDEEFARQVEIQLQIEAEETEVHSEEENAQALPETSEPQECNAPSFKEIMDTELALAIYEREVKEKWKNKEPQDLAAQMRRKKLYETFPDVAKETLSEMLIAHENSFDATVETLLVSTGNGHYLEQPDGIAKFVTEKEIQNKEKIIMGEKDAALGDDEYPYLLKPGTEQIELSMETVNRLRQKADTHKRLRDMFFQRAKEYYENKRFAEAGYYSQIAASHTARFDNASHYAAAILVQYHANIHPEANVIDLHYLRVPEAKNSLDLFIDDRLRKMRQALRPKSVVLRIITGRGKHSPGGARVKPAIMKRLQARGLKFRQQNPGLLEALLKPTSLLTVELQNT